MPRLTEAPELATDRLILRAHRLDDFESCCAIWSHPDVARYTGGTIATREENWARMTRVVGHWAMLGFGYWLVVDGESGRHIGDVGIFERRGDIDARFEEAVEAGWALAPTAHGKGLAHEAMTGVLGWSDANLAGRAVVCMIDEGNSPSVRLAERLGFRSYGAGFHKDKPMLLFERG